MASRSRVHVRASESLTDRLLATTLNQWVQGPEQQRHLGEPFHGRHARMTQQPPAINNHHQQKRRTLRRQLRQQRRALSPNQQKHASQRLVQRLRQLPEVQRARHLALYLPNDGEIDPTPLLAWLKYRNAQAYLPVLKPLAENSLWFVHYHPGTPMITNRFGIPEPSTRHAAHHSRRRPVWALDVILLPLVGFDANGERLGMGGGFYDRTLARLQNGGPRPRLIGVAHDCQGVERLPTAPWDIPLDAIVSDTRLITPER